MTERTPRRDDAGRARAGSMLQMQIYANAREDRLSAAVIDAAGTALAGARIGWKSPREAASYAEYMDAAFLAEVGIGHAREELAAFWPKSGPRWDGLGIASSPAGNTILLVEAKSYVEEMAGGGCKATEPARSKIVLALDRAKRHFGANEDADWTGPFYQYANRLAHLYFIREVVGAQALLVNLCFVDDQWTSPKRPTSADDWRAGIAGVKKALGFGMGPIPGVVDVLLTALAPEELDGPEVPA